MGDYRWNYDAWTPWAQPAEPYFLVSTLDPSFGPLRFHIGQPLFTSIVIFEDGDGTWLFRSNEAAALGRRMIDFLSVPAHRSAFEDRLERAEAELLASLALTDLGDLDAAALLEVTGSIQSKFSAYYELGAFVEPVQIAAQESIGGYLAAHGEALASNLGCEVDGLEPIAYALAEESFALAISASTVRIAAALARLDDLVPGLETPHEAQDELDRIVGQLRDQHPDVFDLLQTHADTYSWSRNNYGRCSRLGPVDVLAEISSMGGPAAAATVAKDLEAARLGSERLLNQKRKLLGLLPPFEANLLSLHDLIGGTLVDHRKRIVMMTNGVLTELLTVLAARLGLPLSDLTKLTPQELPYFVADPSRFAERIAKRHERFLVYQADFGVLDELVEIDEPTFVPMDGPYLAEGADQVGAVLQRLSDRLNIFEGDAGGTSHIQGTVVVPTSDRRPLRGSVRVVRDPTVERVLPGEILVASSTTPDFMAAIHSAIAIVTDWGGQTSHAAITARELGKPCIIGTNYASSVLRTGDLIELDTETGVVAQLGTTG